MRSLKQTGCAACILPHGVLFRGNAEAQIRKYLVAEKRYIKGIIGLPANLFYGMGIPACIIIVEKSEAVGRKGVFDDRMPRAGISKMVQRTVCGNRIFAALSMCGRHNAMYLIMRALCLWEEIERNDYNLNIPRYVFAPDYGDSARYRCPPFMVACPNMI